MVDYIECYPEYLELEDFIKFLISILNLSYFRLDGLRGYEKYIMVILKIYALISIIFTFLCYDRDVVLFGLSAINIVGTLQVLSKTFSIVTKSNALNGVFLFIREVHQITEIDSSTNLARIHLRKILRIIKPVLK